MWPKLSLISLLGATQEQEQDNHQHAIMMDYMSDWNETKELFFWNMNFLTILALSTCTEAKLLLIRLG